MICAYCGRVAHRCRCHAPDSPLRRFWARAHADEPPPRWRTTRYVRGVPPQVKAEARRVLKRHAPRWRAELIAQHGARCAHCGIAESADAPPLVLDHVLPVALGGRSQLDNLQLLCRTCNALKGKLAIDCR